MDTKRTPFFVSPRGIIFRIIIIIFLPILFFCSPVFAFTPKVHMHIGLKIIEHLQPPNADTIELGGIRFAADSEMCNAIRKWPGYFLAGTIGPDGFPDIVFGQTKIHPDTRCNYANSPDGDCDEGSATKSWTDEWLRHLWDSARNESGEEREQALAFVMGYFSHAAGDIWSHTFVNQYANGSWPENYTTTSSLEIVKRHMTTEGIIGNRTPDVMSRVTVLGGIKAPIQFLIKSFVNSPWAIDHGSGSFISQFCKLREKLLSKQPSEPAPVSVEEAARIMLIGDPFAVAEVTRKAKDWLLHNYIDCWTKNIDKGLEEWLKTSEGIARDLFVNEQSDRIWDPHLQTFKNENLEYMLGLNPVNLVTRCLGIPDWVLKVLNPADYLNEQLNEIKRDFEEWGPLKDIRENFRDFIFSAAFGMTYDEFKDYYQNSETYAPTVLGTNTTNEILSLLDLRGGSYLNDETCSIVYNTFVLNKLILLNYENLNQLLFRYNVGHLYSADSYPNVMLGFLKSLDGNHQWRKHAPSAPISEANRSFSKGMPLWVDCLAQRNFFRKVFKDWKWSNQNISMIYKDAEGCDLLSHLPPVSSRVRLLTQNDICTPSYAEITLTNHQGSQQPYAIYVTVEDTEHPTPKTTPCDKPGYSGDIPYSPIVIKPENISYENIFFYKVQRGTLIGAPITCKDEVIYIKLPYCFTVKALLKVYILREIYTARNPVVASNTGIPPNPSEILLDEVASNFEAPYEILCKSCTLPECAGSTMLVTYTPLRLYPDADKPPERSGKIEIKLPCDNRCYEGTLDADDDRVNNKDDNCALTPNRDQRDACKPDGIGDACQYCPHIFDQWVRGLLPDPRAEAMFHDLLDHGLAGPIVIDPILPRDIPGGRPPKPIVGDFFSPLTWLIKDYTRKWVQGGVSDKLFLRNMNLLLHGLSQQTIEYPIKKAALDVTKKKVSFNLPANVKGTFEIAIPRVMLDSQSGGRDQEYRILVNGRKVKYEESKNAEFRTVSIQIPQGAKTIEIMGNKIGPE